MGKALFDLNAPGWRSHELPTEVLDYLRSSARFDADTLVKINPVRAVFACGDYFVKFEVPDTRFKRYLSIFRPKAKLEYRSGKALEAAGIPVIEYLGWLQKGAVNVSVSRKWRDRAPTAGDYMYRTLAQPEAPALHFAELLRDFILRLEAANFRHPDLHLGNLLYSPDDDRFALVDVYGVKQLRRLTRQDWQRDAHMLLELRPVLEPAQLFKLLAALPGCGNAALAEDFYWRDLQHMAEQRVKEWPKRQLQLLRGYPKLAKIDGERILARDEVRRVLYEPDGRYEKLTLAEADAFALFQASVYWFLCGIPHRRVVAYQLPDTVYLEELEHFRRGDDDIPRRTVFERELRTFGVVAPGPLAVDRCGRPALFDPRTALDGFVHRDIFYN